jgi:hypothetical protein
VSEERRCILLVEKVFESGLRLLKGTPVYVMETTAGAIGHFYPDPYKLGAHVFVLADDEYAVLVPGKKLEGGVPVAEPPPNEHR